MSGIPKNLLIHDCMLKQETSKDAFGNITTNDIQLNNVRIVDGQRVKNNGINKDLNFESMMFYDETNSRPRNISFAVDDVISFNNRDYRVVKFDNIYDSEKLHHKEVYLL